MITQRESDADTMARRYIHKHGTEAAQNYAAKLLRASKPNTWNRMIGQALHRNLISSYVR